MNTLAAVLVDLSNSDCEASETTSLIAIAKTNDDKINQILRLYASDIAAIAGFHPWKNMVELFDKYLYQDLEHLRILDCQNVGLELVSRDEEVTRLIDALPASQRRSIKHVKLNAKRDINGSVKANSTLEGISKVLTAVQSMKEKGSDRSLLSNQEFDLLKTDILSTIRTEYGKNCENWALDKYEVNTGSQVESRNAELLVMGWHINGPQYQMHKHGYMRFNRDEDYQQLINRNKSQIQYQICCRLLVDIFPLSTSTSASASSYSISESIGRISDQTMRDLGISSTESLGVFYSRTFHVTEPCEYVVSNLLLSMVESIVHNVLESIDGNCSLHRVASEPLLIQSRVPVEDGKWLLVSCHTLQLQTGLSPLMNRSFIRACKSLGISYKESGSPNVPIVCWMVSSDEPIDTSSSHCCNSHAVTSSVRLEDSYYEDFPSVQIVSINASHFSTRSNDCKMDKQDTGLEGQRDVSFYVIGKVDGISHQLDCSSSDCSDWKPTKVVVELKNRMGKRLPNPPPVYDIIQLATYQIMLNCDYGDLVQSISDMKDDEMDLLDSNGSTAKFHIHRISRHGDPYHMNPGNWNQDNWFEVVLPRLRSFRGAIEQLRLDDGMRYRWLLSPDADKYRIVAHLCPHFDFRNEIKQATMNAGQPA